MGRMFRNNVDENNFEGLKYHVRFNKIYNKIAPLLELNLGMRPILE